MMMSYPKTRVSMRYVSLIILLLLLLAAGIPSPASATTSDVSVVSHSLSPSVLMHGDTGTLAVSVSNNGSEKVSISRAALVGSSDTIVVMENPYSSVGDIGIGATKTFTFTIKAAGSDGMYYPKFVLDYVGSGNSLRYPIPVEIESSEPGLSVLSKPDDFSAGRKSDIVLEFGNLRPNTITSVIITPSGDGLDVVPSGGFIGSLASGASSTVTFTITPHTDSDLTFCSEYRNGNNLHSVSTMIPVILSAGKMRAEPVLTNIEVAMASGTYTVTGDVINAGLEVAKSVVVTSGEGAIPVDPYRVYVVGSLDPDDFSSFEVTFRVDEDVTTVPLVVEYKDVDGNPCSVASDVDLEGVKPQQGAAEFPTAAVVCIILLAAAAGAIAYAWKRR